MAGGIAWNEISKNSNGGTEIQGRWLEKEFSPESLEPFQIIPSRIRALDKDKIRIYWAHDLAGDPMADPLKKDGWKQFHKLVFVSHWQRTEFMRYYGIPHSHTTVIRNAIDPIAPARVENDDKIRIIYHTTPHRGLNILYSAFEHLAKDNPRLHLDVFSSFAVYGWGQRDEEFKDLLDKVKEHPQITYHGAQPNDTVREYLSKAHIFGYPSIFPETSCISLIEAMSAGCLCVHPDYGALPETAASWTLMYGFKEDIQDHVNEFVVHLATAIKLVDTPEMKTRLSWQSNYTNLFYSRDVRKLEWGKFLDSMRGLDPAKSWAEEMLVFRT